MEKNYVDKRTKVRHYGAFGNYESSNFSGNLKCEKIIHMIGRFLTWESSGELGIRFQDIIPAYGM